MIKYPVNNAIDALDLFYKITNKGFADNKQKYLKLYKKDKLCLVESAKFKINIEALVFGVDEPMKHLNRLPFNNTTFIMEDYSGTLLLNCNNIGVFDLVNETEMLNALNFNSINKSSTNLKVLGDTAIIVTPYTKFEDNNTLVPSFGPDAKLIMVQTNKGIADFLYDAIKDDFVLTTPQHAELVNMLSINLNIINRIISSSNIQYELVTPSRVKNKMLHAKGKLPLFEYKNLKLSVGEKLVFKKEYQGGHHASPREHQRRGHYRTLKSGERIWINSCKIGDAKLGKVEKEYEVIK